MALLTCGDILLSEKKQRELRSDLAGNRNIEVEEMNEDANDFIEKVRKSDFIEKMRKDDMSEYVT